MYRTADEHAYGPLLKRIGWVWRALAVILGGAMLLGGLVLTFLLVQMLMQDGTLRNVDYFLFGFFPIFFGMIGYGYDFARRAIIVRSTDRSAFEGRLGKTRAIIGTAFGAYLLLFPLILALVIKKDFGRIDDGVKFVLASIAFGGVTATFASVRGLFAKPPVRVAPIPIAPQLDAPNAIDATMNAALEEDAIETNRPTVGRRD